MSSSTGPSIFSKDDFHFSKTKSMSHYPVKFQWEYPFVVPDFVSRNHSVQGLLSFLIQSCRSFRYFHFALDTALTNSFLLSLDSFLSMFRLTPCDFSILFLLAMYHFIGL